MEVVYNVVIPVFAIIFAGYLSGRLRLLGPGGSDALNGFVYFGALPALFFGAIAKVRLDEILNWPFLAAYFAGMAVVALATLVIGRLLFKLPKDQLAVQNMAALFSNTGYMGIPLAITAFGQAAALPAILATVVNGAVVMALYILWIEGSRSSGGHWLHVIYDALGGIVRSPLVLSAVAGLVVSGLEIQMPKPILTFCDILGAAAPPAALFAMGLFMVGKSFKGDLIEVTAISLLKLLLHPAATWVVLTYFIHLPRDWHVTLLLLSALPTGSLVFVLASQHQVYQQRATGIILATTVLSVLTLSWLLNYLGAR